MAFATTNVAHENVGSAHVFRGNWSGLVSDTSNGTVTGKGFAYSAEFMQNNTTGPENPINVRVTNSSGDWTVSVPYTTTVTNGTFKIVYK